MGLHVDVPVNIDGIIKSIHESAQYCEELKCAE